MAVFLPRATVEAFTRPRYAPPPAPVDSSEFAPPGPRPSDWNDYGEVAPVPYAPFSQPEPERRNIFADVGGRVADAGRAAVGAATYPARAAFGALPDGVEDAARSFGGGLQDYGGRLAERGLFTPPTADMGGYGIGGAVAGLSTPRGRAQAANLGEALTMSAYEGDNPVLREAARPINYLPAAPALRGLSFAPKAGAITRAGLEIGAAAAGVKAAEEVDERLSEDMNPLLRGGIVAGAGILAGGATGVGAARYGAAARAGRVQPVGMGIDDVSRLSRAEEMAAARAEYAARTGRSEVGQTLEEQIAALPGETQRAEGTALLAHLRVLETNIAHMTSEAATRYPAASRGKQQQLLDGWRVQADELRTQLGSLTRQGQHRRFIDEPPGRGTTLQARIVPFGVERAAGAAVGGTGGYQTGDTPEERRRNALVGAIGGAAVGPTAARLVKGRPVGMGIKDVGEEAAEQAIPRVTQAMSRGRIRSLDDVDPNTPSRLPAAERAAIEGETPFPNRPTAEEITSYRDQHYGGTTTGRRTPMDDAERARVSAIPPRTAAQIEEANLTAARRGMGDTTSVDAIAEYRDPLDNLIQRIADAKPLQQQNAELLTKFRARQAGAFTGTLQSGSGEAGMRSAIGAMRGAAERATFEPLRPHMGQAGIDNLTNRIAGSALQPFDKVNAYEAMTSILDGQVPTPSALRKLEDVFPGVTEALKRSNVLPKDPWYEKTFKIAGDLANFPRAVMASGDLSATLRQSAMAAPSHPKAWARAMRDQIGAYRSPERAQEAMERIDAHPLRSFLDDMKVDILPIASDAKFSLREEAFMSRWAGKVPLVDRSQRAYTVALNSMRAGMAYDILGNIAPERLASMTPKQLEAIGRMVNAFTGRGTIPARLENYAPVLNAVFFSPRNNIGKVQAHLSLLSSEPIVVKEAAKSLVAFYATGIGLLAAADAAGFEVGLVPGSSDFGKVVLPGGTRIDIWGGNAQIFRLIANLATGERVNAQGKRYEQNQGATIMRFLRTKLAPSPGLITNLAVGKDMLGDPSRTPEGLAKQALSMLAPLFLQDLVEAVHGAGPVEGGAAGAASFFGVGTQYQEPERGPSSGGPSRPPRPPRPPRPARPPRPKMPR